MGSLKQSCEDRTIRPITPNKEINEKKTAVAEASRREEDRASGTPEGKKNQHTHNVVIRKDACYLLQRECMTFYLMKCTTLTSQNVRII